MSPRSAMDTTVEKSNVANGNQIFLIKSEQLAFGIFAVGRKARRERGVVSFNAQAAIASFICFANDFSINISFKQ